jgi:hypothetical protein
MDHRSSGTLPSGIGGVRSAGFSSTLLLDVDPHREAGLLREIVQRITAVRLSVE